MIKYIELIDFGKFHHEKIEFQPGLNRKQYPNEWGKTTVLWCIYALLYGFSKENTKVRTYIAAYDLFKPIGRETFQAAMVLEVAGKSYHIQRNFLKGQEDTKVKDLATGRMIHPPEFYRYSKLPQPGAYFYGISGRQFLKFFLFLKEEEPEKIYEEGEAFLSSGDQEISLEKSTEHLESQLRRIGNTSRSKSQLGRMQEKLEEGYSRLAKDQGKVSQYELLFERYEKKRIQKEQLEKKLRKSSEEQGLSPSQQKALRALYIKVEELDLHLAENEKAIMHYEEKGQRSKDVSLFGLLFSLFMGLVGVLLALYMYMMMENIWWIPGVFGGISCCAGLKNLFRKNRNKKIMEKYHRAFVLRDKILEEKDGLRHQSMKLLHREILMEELTETLGKEEALYDEEGHIKISLEEVQKQRAQEEELRKEEFELGKMKGSLEELEILRNDLAQIREELSQVEESLQKLTWEKQVLETTLAIFKELKEQEGLSLKQDFLKKTGDYFREVTQGVYRDIGYEEQHGFYVYKQDMILSVKQVSRSTLDIFGFCLRWAMMDMMGAKDIPALYDDPMVYMDEERKAEVLNFFAGTERQILLFERN